MDNTKKAGMLRYRWIIFGVLLIAYFFVYFHRTSTSVIGPVMIGSIGIPISMLALLSSVYFYTYLAMQLPSGFLSDRFGPRRSSAIFLTLAACGAFLTCYGDTFAMLAIGKAMIACGMAVVYIPLMKILAVWFRKNEFASLAGVVIAVGNVGALGAAAPLMILMDTMDWRTVFMLLGLVTLILAFLCLVLIRDHPSQMGFPSIEEIESEETGIPITESSAAKVPILHGLRTAFCSGRKFWMPTLAYFVVYGSIMIYQGLWIKVYFDNTYSFVLSAAWLVTMVAVGKIISSATLGILTDRVGFSKKAVMMIGNIGFLAVWGVIWLYSGQGDYWTWMFINFMFGLFGGFMTLSFGQVKEWFPLSISGTVVAGMNMFLFGGAAIMQSLSYFIIKDKTLQEFQTLWMIMFVCVIFACVFTSLSVEKKKEMGLEEKGV